MNTKKLGRLLSIAFLAVALVAILAVSALADLGNAPTGISDGGNGTLAGLVDGNYYQIAPVTISADGTAVETGEWVNADSATTGLAGLYRVRFTNEAGDDFSAASDLIYVYGTKADRANVGFAADGTLPRSGKAVADFYTGKWSTVSTTSDNAKRITVGSTEFISGTDLMAAYMLDVEASVINDVARGVALADSETYKQFLADYEKVTDHYEYQAGRVAPIVEGEEPVAHNAAKLLADAKAAEAAAKAEYDAAVEAGADDVAAKKAALDAATQLVTIRTKALKRADTGWTQIKNTYNAMTATVEKLNALENVTAEDVAAALAAKDAKYSAILTRANNVPITYAYNPDEIIKADELESFQFKLSQRVWGITYAGFSSRIDFYATDLEGNVDVYPYTTAATSNLLGNGNSSTVNVDLSLKGNWEKDIPGDVYILGMKVYVWSGVNDIDKCNILFMPDNIQSAGNDYPAGEPCDYGNNFYNSIPNFEPIPTSYTISDPVYPKLEGIEGGFGEIKGLDKNASYQYAQFVLNSDGTALTVNGEWTDLGDTVPTGILAIRKHVATDENGTKLYTKQSDFIYVYGAKADRQDVFTADVTIKGVTNRGISVSRGKYNQFLAGAWTGKYGDYLDGYNSFFSSGTDIELYGKQGSTVQYAHALLIEYQILKALNENDAATAASVLAWVDENLTKLRVSMANATSDTFKFRYEYSIDLFEDILEKYTGATSATDKQVSTVKSNYDAAAAGIIERAQSVAMKYAYNPDEIININEISYFKFRAAKRYSSFSYEGSFASDVVVYVADMNGNITTHKYTTAANTKLNQGTSPEWTNYEVSFVNKGLWTPALPETGYVVGLELFPWAHMDDYNKIYNYVINSDRIDSNVYWSTSAGFRLGSSDTAEYLNTPTNFYGITSPVTNEALEGVSGGTGEILGIDTDAKYLYATYTINSDGSALVESDWQTLDFDNVPVGLVSLKKLVTEFDGVEIYTRPSDVFYVATLLSQMNKNLGADPSTDKLNNKQQTPHFFVPGTWTAGSIAAGNTKLYYNNYVVYEQGMGTPTQTQLVWLYEHTREEAMAALESIIVANEKITNADFTAADITEELRKTYAFYHNICCFYDNDTTEDFSFNFGSQPKIAAGINAGITYGSAEWEAKELAAKQGLANELQVRSAKYGFLTSEIIPVENAKSITLYKQQTGSANASFNAVMSATFYVYNDGIVTPYTVKAPSISCKTAQTYQVNLEALIPQGGYIVAVEIYPYAEVDAETLSITKIATETNGNPVKSYKNQINLRFVQNHARVGYVKDSFTFAYGALEGVRVENGEVIGLDPDATYQYAYVGLDTLGEGLAPYGNWANLDQNDIPTGLIAIRQEIEAGMYTSNVIVYVPVEEAKNVIHLNSDNTLDYNTDRRSSKDYRETLNFVPLKWNYYSASGAFKSIPYSVGSGGQLITHNVLTDAKDDPDAYAKASANMVKEFGEWYFTYAYGGDEVIPMSEIGSISYTIVRQQACFTIPSGNFRTKLALVVLTDDGEIEIRESVAKDIDYWNPTKVTFIGDDFAKTDGLVLGMVIYPYAEATNNITLKWYQAANPNAYITFDPVDYVIKSESTAPAFKIEKDSYGYIVTITNAIADAYYEYSTDNKNWTTLEKGESVFTAPTADVYYVRVAEKGVYHASNTATLDLINYVFADKPELELDGNALNVEDGIYEYCKVNFGNSAEYADLSSTTLTAGVWAVRVKATATSGASECQYIYVPGEDVGTIRVVAQANSANAGFVSGAWTGNVATMYTRSQGQSAELHLNTGNSFALADRRAYNLKYQFTDEEIVSIDDAIDIVFNKISFSHGYLADGYSLSDISVKESRIVSAKGQTMARVYVVGGDAPYYDVVTDVTYDEGFKFAIASALKGKEGYITAVELYPLWSVYGPDNKTDLGDDCISACVDSNKQTFVEIYTYKLEASATVIANEAPAGETVPGAGKWEGSKINNQLGLYSNGKNRYEMIFALQPSTVPEITVRGSQITVKNYSKKYNYAYSIDGDSWTEFEGNYFLATKPSTEYYVKVVENGIYSESAPSEPVTTPLAVISSASLVLDGQIGLKLYIDVADDVVVESLDLNMTKNNADYDDDVTGEDFGIHFRQGGKATLEKGTSFSSKVCYDEALDLYYVILYTAAKDVDNVHFENHIYLNGDEEENNCFGMGAVKVCDYIDAAKALAAAGNEEFVAALDLINNIENYTAYADNYFGKGALEAYTSDAANAEFTAPTRTNDVPGLSFVATSLVLEDNVTIRHYFTVTDAEVFETYTSAIGYKVKGDYVYYDITDIAAQDIGAAETLTINDANGNPIYSVTYSVANYIQNMLDSDDANLVSLVNAMYDYYVAAVDYTK